MSPVVWALVAGEHSNFSISRRIRFFVINIPSSNNKTVPSEISGSQGGEYEDNRLFGCCAV
jgi:hypothetical protein